VLLLIEASQAVFYQLRARLDVEGVLGDFPFLLGSTEIGIILLEEVDELTFLFWVQAGLDLHGFSWVFSVDLQGLGILVCFESVGHQGYPWVEWRHGPSEVENP
jgi:hypothetical protein